MKIEVEIDFKAQSTHTIRGVVGCASRIPDGSGRIVTWVRVGIQEFDADIWDAGDFGNLELSALADAALHAAERGASSQASQ